MAKKVTHQTIGLVQAIPFSLLYSDPALNWGRKISLTSSPETLGVLRGSMTTLGWKKNDLVECTPMTPEQQGIYHARLIEEYARYKELGEAPTASKREQHELAVFKALRCDKNGKVIKPQFLVMSGNQRFSQVIAASTDRWEQGIKEGWGALGVEVPKDEDSGADLGVKPEEAPESWVISKIPMQEISYASEAEQIEAQMQENTLKLVGNQEPSRLDVAYAGRRLVQLAGRLYTESELARKLSLSKRGVQQDVWRMVAIDYYGGPELNYIERCCLKEDDPDYINYTWRLSNNWDKDMKANSNLYIARMDPEKVDAMQKKARASGADPSHINWPKPCTHAEFVEYFNWHPSEEHVSVKRTSFADMESAANGMNSDFLKDFMDAAARGQMEEFKEKYGEFAQCLNQVVKLATLVGAELCGDVLGNIIMDEDPTKIMETILGWYPEIEPAGEPVKATVFGTAGGATKLLGKAVIADEHAADAEIDAELAAK